MSPEATRGGASRTVLVTGATGFAGSHLMDALLAAGHRVRILTRRTSSLRWIPSERVEAYEGDVRDAPSLSRLTAGVSWVFHFGGATRARSADGFFRINTEGTRLLAEAWLADAPRDGMFMFCSSLAASGPAAARDRPRLESDPPRPITAYGQSKLAAERWLSDNLAPRRRLVTVRPPAIYGPRDEATLAFFIWARRGWLLQPGARSNRVSLLYVRDLARGSMILAGSGASGTFHLSDGGYYSWDEVGAATAAALGRKLHALRIPAWAVRLAGELGEGVGRVSKRMPVVNRSKVRDILQPYWICGTERAAGFSTQTDLAEGMRETVAWYQSEGWL